MFFVLQIIKERNENRSIKIFGGLLSQLSHCRVAMSPQTVGWHRKRRPIRPHRHSYWRSFRRRAGSYVSVFFFRSVSGLIPSPYIAVPLLFFQHSGSDSFISSSSTDSSSPQPKKEYSRMQTSPFFVQLLVCHNLNSDKDLKMTNCLRTS